MDIVYLVGPIEAGPKQKIDFEIAGSHIVNPSRILGQLAMKSEHEPTQEHEQNLEKILDHFEDTQRMIGQLAMELQLVIPESNQQ